MKNNKKVLIKKIDNIVKILSSIQIELMNVGITNDEYNEVTDFIHGAKEYLINTKSYRN